MLFMLISMQKINFIITSFLRYCREIAKFLFWVIWACLATHTENDSGTLKKPLTFISRQKINFILHVFLEILQRYCKPVFGVLWGCLAMHIQSYTISLQKIFVFICRQKISFTPMLFLEILQDMQTYFEYFGACLVTHTKNDSINF